MNRPSSRRIAISCAALVLLSLAACLLFVSAYPLPEVRNDAVEYLDIARNVAAGKGFTQDGITPMVYRPPLFSVLLGGWFFLTGTSSVFSAAIFQSLLHALGISAAFFLFLALTPSLPWAAGASVFLAANPLLVTRAVFVLQEPTILLFTTLSVLASVRLLRVPSSGRAALAGVAWGVCTLAKTVCWFAPFLLLAMRLLPARLRWSWRGREAAYLLLCFVAVIAPWTIRNYIHFHRFIPVNGQGTGILEWNVSHAEPPGALPGNRLIEDLDRHGVTGEQRISAMTEYVRGNLRYFLVDRTVSNALHFACPARDWWWSRGRFGPGDPRPWYWTIHDYGFWILYLFLAYRTLLWV
ncbi:MAG: phospholipid carrier-dependent glycosyltransferase, partial [Candidatus Deferrimicrobiaceae bacterium]